MCRGSILWICKLSSWQSHADTGSLQVTGKPVCLLFFLPMVLNHLFWHETRKSLTDLGFIYRQQFIASNPIPLSMWSLFSCCSSSVCVCECVFIYSILQYKLGKTLNIKRQISPWKKKIQCQHNKGPRHQYLWSRFSPQTAKLPLNASRWT